MHLEKKIMVISGASKGIGKYLSEYYAEQDFFVIGISRGEAQFSHSNYVHHCIDITDETQVISLFSKIRKQYGQLDVLINNAGVASMNHVLLTPSVSLNKVFETNFYGTFFCSREASKIMMKKKKGRIVNTSTVAVPMLIDGEAIYAASKSAVETFTKVLAKELAPFNITCNAIGPTPIDTDLIRGVPSSKINNIISNLMIKRLGDFKDVSNVVDFFISDNSNYITSQVIYLGGAGN